MHGSRSLPKLCAKYRQPIEIDSYPPFYRKADMHIYERNSSFECTAGCEIRTAAAIHGYAFVRRTTPRLAGTLRPEIYSVKVCDLPFFSILISTTETKFLSDLL